MTAVDLDLHGYVGIRLLDATRRDVATVVRQLGPIVKPLDREPDVVVSFVDRIAPGRALTYVGVGDAGFGDDAFYVLRGKTNATGRARIPMQDVGGVCEIVCERSLPAVPLLLPIVNLTALAKGLLPMHATAFVQSGRGVLATGWSKGGKTELLLAASTLRGRYVGDEWVYLTPACRMLGVPEPIRLWRWQLEQLPELARTLTSRERLRLTSLGAATSIVGITTAAPGAIGSVARRAGPILARQVYVQVPPRRLFGSDGMAPEASLDTLVLVTSHESRDVTLRRVDSDEIVRRMPASLAEEREPFMAYYRQFRFAFPGLSSPVVEQARTLEERLLQQVLAGREAWHLSHPYPVRIDSLVDPLQRAVAAGDGVPVHTSAALLGE